VTFSARDRVPASAADYYSNRINDTRHRRPYCLSAEYIRTNEELLPANSVISDPLAGYDVNVMISRDHTPRHGTCLISTGVIALNR